MEREKEKEGKIERDGWKHKWLMNLTFRLAGRNRGAWDRTKQRDVEKQMAIQSREKCERG